jgi:hypothetical protein
MKLAVPQLEDPVGSTRQLMVVGYEDHAQAPAGPKAEQKIVQFLTRLGIQIARRLVGEKQRRLGRKGSCYGDTLLFST